ncbi:MAG: DnaJ family domain-containing protein [Acidimicrobiia bacterium]
MSDRRWEDQIERQIREAIERGEFDNLEGAGKPIDTSDRGPGWWIRRYLTRVRQLERELEAADLDREIPNPEPD